MSQKVPLTDLELTFNQQGIPQREKEEKNGEKIWGMVLKNRWYPKNRTKDQPYKTFDRFTGPKSRTKKSLILVNKIYCII